MDDDDRDYTSVVPFPERLEFEPIGIVRSPYKQRHGTPRQPGATSDREHAADSTIELFAHRVAPEALEDLDRFSHAWVMSWFHLNGPRRRPMVRPPRGGPKRGVFATRSPHRPVPLGLSVVEVLSVERNIVRVRGLDLLDGTPVVDLKPYLVEVEAVPHASRGWLDHC